MAGTGFEVDPRWYESFFGRDWLVVADQADVRRDRAEVDFLVEQLCLEPGARVLDLACGQGRHAIELAARGFGVTGLDISEPSLAIARERADARGVAIEFVRQDMRDLETESTFDAVLSLCSSFGFLPDDDEDARVVDRAARALRPGGRLVIDTVNDLWLARNFQPRGWQTLADGTVVTHDRRYDVRSRRSSAIWTLIRPNGSRSELRHSMRVYTCPELVRLMTQVGLEADGVWGGTDASDYGLDSRRLIVCGQKT